MSSEGVLVVGAYEDGMYVGVVIAGEVVLSG